jgi:hypothetical protein
MKGNERKWKEIKTNGIENKVEIYYNANGGKSLALGQAAPTLSFLGPNPNPCFFLKGII